MQTSSMDPDCDWQFLTFVAGGTDHIESEAVFRQLVADVVAPVAHTLWIVCFGG